jgi:hypothetical protein
MSMRALAASRLVGEAGRGKERVGPGRRRVLYQYARRARGGVRGLRTCTASSD